MLADELPCPVAERFGIEIQLSQIMLFLYLVVGAIGVIVGGMIGDRIGRDRVIWLSILGSLPFALMLLALLLL